MVPYSNLPSFVVLGSLHIMSCMAISCYSCNSFNNSSPECEDPFIPTARLYQQNCMQGMEGRVGLFPAHYCTKLNGRSFRTGLDVMYRGCSLDSMADQCSIFKLEDELYEGCLATCESDACNAAHVIGSRGFYPLLLLVAISTFGFQ